MMSGSQRFWFWTVVWVSVVTLSAPTLVVLGASFTAGNIIAFPPEGLSLRWYEKIVMARELQQAFLRSLIVSVICTVISVPVGTLAGIAMARFTLRFGNAIQMYLLLPFTIWSVSSSAALLDPDLEHAAANCGAGRIQTFLYVTLPAVMPGVITGSLLMFILAMNEFLVSLLLTDARTVTLPVQIYNSIRSIITPDLAAISVVFIAVAALAIALLDKLVGLDIFLKSK